jgi:CHAD domain-containing protein
MPIPAELYESLRKRLTVFSHKSKRIDDDIDALHRTRVASRRLRELLPVLRLDGRTTRKLDRRLRRVTKRLGAVRDLDVLMVLIEELRRDRRYSKTALAAVQSMVEDKRKIARERLKAQLSSGRLQKITRRLKRVARELQADDAQTNGGGKRRRAQATAWAIEARAARRAARVLETIEAAGTVYAAAPLHQVRIALKKLRFALELTAELEHRPAARDIATLKASQDLLGRLHDLQVLIEHASDIQATRLVIDPVAWRELGLLIRILERDCRKLHARYVRNASRLAEIAKSAIASTARVTRAAHVA